MHKKTIRYIIGTLVCIALSLIIEIFFYNNHALNNTNPSQEVSFSTIYNKEASVVNLDINNQYINKLEIEYNVTQDIDYTLKYHTKDLFNKDKEEIVYDIFDDSFHKSVTNLNNQVSNLTIEFNSPKTDTQIINRIVIDNSFHFNFTRTFCIFLSFLLIYSIVCFFKQGFQTEKIPRPYYIIVVKALHPFSGKILADHRVFSDKNRRGFLSVFRCCEKPHSFPAEDPVKRGPMKLLTRCGPAVNRR